MALAERRFESRGETVTVTASFGVASTEHLLGKLTPEGILDAADRALYRSKEAGRDCVHVLRDDEMVRYTGPSEGDSEDSAPSE
jgi:PleD family two-component response regulator